MNFTPRADPPWASFAFRELGARNVPIAGSLFGATLAAMDAMGIDVQVLSINPFWYRKDRDTAAAIVKVNNERLAELSAAYPRRLTAFASLSLQAPDLAAEQLEQAMTRQGLRGAAIGGSVDGEDFYDPKFHRVWVKAEELGAVLFIHPQSPPELARRFRRNGWLSNTIGNPLDTTIALLNIKDV